MSASNFPWLSVSEESVFLQNELANFADLLRPPDGQSDDVDFDTQVHQLLHGPELSSEAIGSRLEAICIQQRHPVEQWSQFRLQGLLELWKSREKCLKLQRETQIKTEAKKEEAEEGKLVDISSQLTLVLLFPLLEHSSTSNPAIQEQTLRLLGNVLANLAPLSVIDDGSSLDGLDDLLGHWSQTETSPGRLGQIATCLVTLACVRKSLCSVIKCIQALHAIKAQLSELPVYDLMSNLLNVEGAWQKPSVILGYNHLLSWKYLSNNRCSTPSGDLETGRVSLTCSKTFLYTTDESGCGVRKIGFGHEATLRGHVYAKNDWLPSGFVAFAHTTLVHRPLGWDGTAQRSGLVQLLDPDSLETLDVLDLPIEMKVDGMVSTINLVTDGSYFYWLRAFRIPEALMGTLKVANIIFVDTFAVEAIDDHVPRVKVGSRTILERKSTANGVSQQDLFCRVLLGQGIPEAIPTPDSSSSPADTSHGVVVTAVDPSSTTCAINLKTLDICAVWTEGAAISFLVSPQIANQGFREVPKTIFSANWNNNPSKILAIALSYDSKTGSFLGRSELGDCGGGSLGWNKGACLSGMGATYDPYRNLIWTASNDRLDEYRSSSLTSVHFLRRKLALGEKLEISAWPPGESGGGTKMAIVQDILSVLEAHVGLISEYATVASTSASPTSQKTKEQIERDFSHPQILGIATTMFQLYSNALNVPASSCMISAVRNAIMHSKAVQDHKPGLRELQAYLVRILRSGQVCATFNQLVSDTLVSIHAKLYDSSKERQMAYLEMVREDKAIWGFQGLKSRYLTLEVRNLLWAQEPREIVSHLEFRDFLSQIMKDLHDHDSKVVKAIPGLHLDHIRRILTNTPLVHTDIKYLQTVIFKLTFLPNPEAKTILRKVVRNVLQDASSLLKILSRSLEAIVLKSNGEAIELRLRALERVAMGSLLGSLLSTVATLSSHDLLLNLDDVKHHIQDFVQLNLESRKIAHNMRVQLEDVLDSEKDDCDLSDSEEAALSEARPNANLVPCPWDEGRTIESMHPVRENYKLRETFTVMGARHLYLFFDPRSSTQYDYDKVIVHAGKSVNGKKIGEFGGNTLGFGSKSVLGSGWPTQPIVVDGDSVTVTFEMRSSREQGVPDKVLWGFRMHVKTINLPPKGQNGTLSYFSELAMALGATTFAMLTVLFHGQPVSPEEIESEVLLKSRLLQQCTWQAKNPSSGPESLDEELHPQDTIRIPLPPALVSKLRSLSETRLPPLRPSVKQILRPEVMEEAIMSSVIKHLGFQEFMKHFNAHEKEANPEYVIFCDIVSETYLKFHALIRRLQVLAELENQWNTEVEDIREGMTELDQAFFSEYQHHESKSKELSLLCFLKGIDASSKGLQRATEQLKVELQKEATGTYFNGSTLTLTDMIVKGILERIELLLQVSINTGLDGGTNGQPLVSRSLQNWPQGGSRRLITKQQSIELERSLDDSILQIPKLKRPARKAQTARSVIEHLAKGDNTKDDQAPESVVLDQLFAFIGSHPEKAISAQSFIKAALIRRQRSRCRIQAFALMKGLLTSTYAIGGTDEILVLTSVILQSGPRADELTCGSLVEQVRESFSETLVTLVQLMDKDPTQSKISMARLATVPYSHEEESCLVKSGLLRLLDRLCGFHNMADNEVEVEQQSAKHKLSELAWVSFKVLTNRCIDWEENVSSSETSGLANQVSSLLTNHLLQASQSSKDFLSCSVLQEVLTVLMSLVRCKIGRDILSQPKCVSTLLTLMLESRLSPKMILSIARLCHIALPLMSADNCEQVQIPEWFLNNSRVPQAKESTPMSKIVDLLVTKIGDFIVPGFTASVPQIGAVTAPPKAFSDQEALEAREEENSPQLSDGPSARDSNTLSLYVHKREDETPQDIIQRLLNANNEIRIFRPVGNESMEKVVKVDKDLGKTQKGELVTEDATLVLRKATKMAQLGFTVSIEAPLRSEQSLEHRLQVMEVMCKERNATMMKSNPQRPFVSSLVANTLAAEVIALIHSLLQSNKAHLWCDAIQSVLKRSLENFKAFVQKEDQLLRAESGTNLFEMYAHGRNILASLSILGCFEETLKEGMEVVVVSEDHDETIGSIQSLNWAQWTAMVSLSPDLEAFEIPFQRLKPKSRALIELFRPLFPQIIKAAEVVLVPDANGQDHLSTPLPGSGDGQDLRLMLARLVSELRASLCATLALYSQDEEFSSMFMQESCHAVDMLKCLAKEVWPSDRFEQALCHCTNLRSLYRDSIKPPMINHVQPKLLSSWNHWNPHLAFPPLKSLLFTYELTGITYQAEPALASGVPRGNMVYAQKSLSKQHPYFEINILSLGPNHEEATSPLLSIGLAPKAEKKEGNWNNPTGTVFLHNNGRLVHYNGISLLQWRSIRFDRQISPGDIVGMGWEPTGSKSSDHGQLYFTQNSQRLSQELEGVSLTGLYPVLHLQKKDIRVRANFGQMEFAYKPIGPEPGHTPHDDPGRVEEDEESLNSLPFTAKDSDAMITVGDHRTNGFSFRPAPKVRVCGALDPKIILEKRLTRHGNPRATTGPVKVEFTNLDDDSEDEDDLYDQADHLGGSSDEDDRPENINSLLVKSWESRVFPVIRRRFRNEAERRDGLDQIKGALSLGMADIARQTVEFLYEENGGIPNELHLPTLEDMREEMLQLSIDRVKKGDSVLIKPLELDTPSSVCSTSQLKTFGLMGEILDVDKISEIVLVECYLKSEGILVSFWYPLPWLAKPTQSHDGKQALAGGGAKVNLAQSPLVHRELINQEFVLSRLYCRLIYLNFHRHAQYSELLQYAPESPRSSKVTMLTSSLLLLEDVDTDNLLLVANAALANDTATNMINNFNLTHRSAADLEKLNPGEEHKLFMQDDGLVEQEIKRILQKIDLNTDQGQDHLLEIARMITECIQHAQDYFYAEEIRINDISTLKSLIQFRDSCAVVLSVKLPNELHKSHPEDLQIQIQTMSGHENRANGLSSAKNVLQYPVLALGGDDFHERAFPEVILPTNLIRVSQGGGAESGTTLQMLGIPAKYPLALKFIQELVQFQGGQGCSKMLAEILANLSHFYLHLDLPPILRQLTLGLVTKVAPWVQGPPPNQFKQLLHSLAQELSLMHDKETEITPLRYSNLFQITFDLLLDAKDTTKAGMQPDTFVLPKLEKAWVCVQELKALQTGEQVMVNGEGCIPSPSRWIFLLHLPSDLDMAMAKSSIVQTLAPWGGLTPEGFIPDNDHSQKRAIILEIRFHGMMAKCLNAIKGISWINVGTKDIPPPLVATLDKEFHASHPAGQSVFEIFLKEKLLEGSRIRNVIHEIFQAGASLTPNLRLAQQSVLESHSGSQVREIVRGLKLTQESDLLEEVQSIMEIYGSCASNDPGSLCQSDKEAEDILGASHATRSLDERQFTTYVLDRANLNVVGFYKSLLRCGYTLHLDPRPELQGQGWRREVVMQLRSWLQDTSQDLGLSPYQIHPDEVQLSSEDLLKPQFNLLQGKSNAELRWNATALLNWNRSMFQNLIPYIPLSYAKSHELSTARCLREAKELLLYDSKVEYFNQILSASSQRGKDQVPPDVVLDPLQAIGSNLESLANTWFYQAWTQLKEVNSSQLCVPLAHGGDPEFPFKVKMSGEEVHGTSGSFRHFLSQITEEFHGTVLGLGIPYLGSGPFKGQFQLRSVPLSWINARLLQFLGQLIGVALRAGIPLVLDMMPTFWRALLDQKLTIQDLEVADSTFMAYIQEIASVGSCAEFETFLEDHQYPKFTFISNAGIEQPLCPNGFEKYLSFTNKGEYAHHATQFKLAELSCQKHVAHIKTGLSTLVPMDIIDALFTPEELELKVCGTPRVSVNQLQKHTIYQAGLTASEDHIQYFWSVLESFTPRQISKFVRFASNQDRLPPDPPGLESSNHLPPFPMKIAPSDKGDQDIEGQNIRVETCMFMVKLPRYPSYDMMREKILFAINSAYDPLSG